MEKGAPDTSGPLLGLGGVDQIRGRRTNQPIVLSKSPCTAVLGAAIITRSDKSRRGSRVKYSRRPTNQVPHGLEYFAKAFKEVSRNTCPRCAGADSHEGGSPWPRSFRDGS